MNIITANPGLWLANNDIHSETFEYFLFEAIQILQENLALFLVSILKTSANVVEDRCAYWGKTLADRENNIKYDEQVLHNHTNNPKAVTVN